jgi:hypothetical protein
MSRPENENSKLARHKHRTCKKYQKIYVSCLSGVATWYVETKHLTLLALLYKFPAVESSAQLYQRYKPSAVEVWDNLFRGSNPVAVPEREGWDNLGAPYMSQMYYMKGRYNKIQLITRHP